MQIDLRSGDLASTPVAALLLEALRQGTTGILKLAQQGGDARLYLRNGWPVGCQVFQGFKPLARYLLSQGLIDMETLDRSLVEMSRTRANHGEVLLRMGAIEPEVLEQTLLQQQTDYLGMIVRLDSGKYELTAAEELPGWTRGVPMCSAYRAILTAMEAPASEALRRQTLLEMAGYPVVLGADATSLWPQLGWSEAELEALALLMTPISQDEYLGHCGLEPGRAAAMLATLRLLGLLEVSEPIGFQEVAGFDPQVGEPSAAIGGAEEESPGAAASQSADSPDCSVPADAPLQVSMPSDPVPLSLPTDPIPLSPEPVPLPGGEAPFSPESLADSPDGSVSAEAPLQVSLPSEPAPLSPPTDPIPLSADPVPLPGGDAPFSPEALADSPGWSVLWPAEPPQPASPGVIEAPPEASAQPAAEEPEPQQPESPGVVEVPSEASAPPMSDSEPEPQGTRIFGSIDLAPASAPEAPPDAQPSSASDGPMSPACEPFFPPSVPVTPEVWRSSVPPAAASASEDFDPPVAWEPSSDQVVEPQGSAAAGGAADVVASAQAAARTPVAPPTPDQHIAEALLEAYEGWRAERDAMKLERRLWGIINFSKGL